jgi:hypothetical protein
VQKLPSEEAHEKKKQQIFVHEAYPSIKAGFPLVCAANCTHRTVNFDKRFRNQYYPLT